METKANYVAVGAFVLACILGIVIALLWLAGFQYSREYALYQTSFVGPVTGLGDGTPVRYNGIDVGRIQDLNFDPSDPKKVVVKMQIKPDLKIPSDSEASIASEGLTGGNYVEIEGGSAGAPKLGDDGNPVPTIRSTQSTLQLLQESAPKLIEKLSHVADDLQKMLGPDNRAALTRILANVDITTAALAKSAPDLQTTFANAAEATGTLKDDLKDFHLVIANANATFGSATVAFGKVDKLAADADAFVTGDGLGQVAQLITQTRALMASLTRLSNQLDREPTKLIFGDRHKGYDPDAK